MLEDITYLTEIMFRQIIPKNMKLQSASVVYDVYSSLQCVIHDTSIVANHYLALDFSEYFLQHYSLEETLEKWRDVVNYDLTMLNKSIRNYLMQLRSVAFPLSDSSEFETILKFYDSKNGCAFIRDEYNVGFVSPKNILTSITLKVDSERILSIQKIFGSEEELKSSEKYRELKKTLSDMEDRTIRDLSTYDDRIALKKELLEKQGILEKEAESLKEYILGNYTLKDLMEKRYCNDVFRELFK